MNSLAPPTSSTFVNESLECPLCSAPEQKILFEYGGKSLRTCLRCAATYLFPQPSPETVAAHFENADSGQAKGASKDEAKHLEYKFERNREKVLSRVAHYITQRRQPGTILDVGCATGLFLARFFGNSRWQTWGLEPSPGAAAETARKGIRIYRGRIEQAKLSDSSFDVITVLDAFYYFPRPQAELAEFKRVLKSDGLLVLEFPLATSRIWRSSRTLGKLLSGSRRPLLESSDHLFYYTPKSISRLLELNGFRVQTILPLPGNRQARLHRDLVFRAYWAFSQLLCFLSRSSIFLGPRFLVAAVKTVELDSPGGFREASTPASRIAR